MDSATFTEAAMGSFAPVMPLGMHVEEGPKDKIHIMLNKDVYFDNDTIKYGDLELVAGCCI